jgi:hypothetical protein
VQTDLGRSHRFDPHATPLAAFIAEVMATLRDNPEATEVAKGAAASRNC